MRIRDFYSTLDFSISILNGKRNEDLRSFETNFDTIMRRSSYYITKLLNDRQDELAEDFDEYDLILDDYDGIVDEIYQNTNIPVVSMKYIATKYLCNHRELIPELEAEIKERGLSLQDEEAYGDDFHENLLTATMAMQIQYENDVDGLEEIPFDDIQVVLADLKEDGNEAEAFKKIYDKYGNMTMLPFHLRRQLIGNMYYCIFGIKGSDDRKNPEIAKIKNKLHLREYSRSYLEQVESIYRNEIEEAILTMVYQLDRFGEISEKIDIHNAKMRRVGLPGLGYQFDETGSTKDLPRVETLMTKEKLGTLGIDSLLRLNSFYNNRCAKIISEYAMSLFVIGELDAIGNILDGEDITKQNVGEETLSNLLIKYQTLILPIKSFYADAQSEVDANPYDFSGVLVNEDREDILPQKTLYLDEKVLLKELRRVWKKDYQNYFSVKLPDMNNKLEDDASFTNTLYNPVFLSYRFKNMALKAEYAYLHFLSQEQPEKSLNFGIVIDGDEEENDNSILLASDGELNLPNRLHIFKRDFTDFLVAFTGKPLARIYEGFNDFTIGGEYISSQLLLPISKDHEKYLKALKSGKLKAEGDTVSNINPLNEGFIKHIEYCMNSSKFMEAYKAPIQKANKKGKIVTERVQVIKFVDLTDGKRYIQKSDGRIVDNTGREYGKTDEERGLYE